MRQLTLDLDEIQGDILHGLQKDAEAFLFFKIINAGLFKRSIQQGVAQRLTSTREVEHRASIIRRRQQQGVKAREAFPGLNLGFTRDGLNRLIGARRPGLDPSFEKGANHPDILASLHDPPQSIWLSKFVSDRIDGAFLVTGPGPASAKFHADELLRSFGTSIKIVYSETGQTRPAAARGHEHFGF